MSKLNLLVFLGIIIVAFSLAQYFQHNQTAIAELNPTPIEQPKANNSSLDEIYKFHKNRTKTSNVTKSGADSDKSECSMVPKASENVITNFAGYVLAYPCTARSKGTIRTEKSESGDIINQEFTLHLKIQLGNEESSIWYDRDNKKTEGRKGFFIILRSNGKPHTSTLFDNLNDYTLVKTDEIAELKTYYKTSNPRRVIGILKNSKDASGYPPSVSCYLDAVDEIDDVFSDLYNMSYKYASCSAHWMLTKDISLVVHSFDAQYAYKFKDLYKMINPGIEKIIIEKPN